MHALSTVPSATYGEDFVRSFGILSTFPPTACGIATFSAALAAGLIAHGATVDVVRCGPAAQLEDALVLASLDDGLPSSFAAALDILNATDVAIIQHEYGLYAGVDGESILTLLAGVVVPTVVVAHTVVSEPTANQRLVLEQVCGRADVVVVMTDTAQARLLAGFDVDASKVMVIPHGAATPPAKPSTSGHRPARSAATIVDVGSAGPGQRDRMGDRRDGHAERHASAPGLRRGRGDPPQGSCAVR